MHILPIIGIFLFLFFFILVILYGLQTRKPKTDDWITYKIELRGPLRVNIWHNDDSVTTGVFNDETGVIEWRGEKLSEEEKAEALRRFLGLDKI